MRLQQYIKKNQTLWLLVFVFACLCHGPMLLSHSIGIDTEDMITLGDLFYGGWLETGRQGLVFLKILTDTLTFNPYLSGAVTLGMLTLSCILWSYYFQRVSGRENGAGQIAFSAILLASTILTEQLYFKLQAMEISIGFCLVACSLLIIYDMIEKKESHKRKRGRIYIYCIAAILINLLVFSIYQVFVALFIFGAVAGFIQKYFFSSTRREQESKEYLGFIGTCFGIFLAAFLLNQIITGLFFSGSDYLASQISWFSQPISICLYSIYAHIRDVVTGNQIYYAKTFVVYVLWLLVAMLVFFKCNHGKKGKGWAGLGALALCGAPFYMTVLCGTTPVMRSQLVLPFTLAYMAYVTFLLQGKRKILRYAAVLLAAVTVYLQLGYTMQLNYTDRVRYEADVRTASSVIEEINALQGEENTYPVVFIGKHSAQLNNACIRGEVIGYSFFEWDTEIEPYGFFGTRRILGFFHTLGANYVQADAKMTGEAGEYSRQMPCWPAQGSVQLWKNMIVIKLSDCP